MRKIVWMMGVSLDGFIEGPNREIDWHLVDEELHQHFNDYLRSCSMFISGRVTHDLMASYWPAADVNPSASPTEREFAGIWRDKPKIVFSRTLEHAEWNTEIVRAIDSAAMSALASEPGGDMVLGGADLGGAFLRLGLVDALQLYVHPVLIGRGKPMFPAFDGHIPLRRIEARTFGNGVTLNRYDVRG